MKFELKYAWAPFIADLSLFSNAIIPNNYGGESETAFYNHPIGTGPFEWEVVDQGPVHQAGQEPGLLAAGQAVPGQRRVRCRPRREHP